MSLAGRPLAKMLNDTPASVRSVTASLQQVHLGVRRDEAVLDHNIECVSCSRCRAWPVGLSREPVGRRPFWCALQTAHVDELVLVAEDQFGAAAVHVDCRLVHRDTIYHSQCNVKWHCGACVK